MKPTKSTEEESFVMRCHHVLIITLVGSLLFMSLPSFSEILYVQHPNFSRISCNEWIWTAGTTAWIVLIFRMLRPQEDFEHFITCHAAFCFFLATNLLWIMVPLLQSLHNECDATVVLPDDDMNIQIAQLTGAKAAWPALWNVAILSIPAQRLSPILEGMGLSTTQALPFHIWAANAALLWLILHTILLSVVHAYRTESISA